MTINTAGKTVVVNVACGSWFPRGQDRLAASVAQWMPNATFMGWKDEYPPGCSTHQDKPYQFKTEAMRWACDQGYETAIWADASCWFCTDPAPLVNTIRTRGYWICTLGWTNGQWCSDHALNGIGMDRERLFGVTHLAATFYGFSTRSSTFRQYLDYMTAKQPWFAGPYRNAGGEASRDGRVLGHRHDQTFLSQFAYERKLVVDWPPCFFDYAIQKSPGNAESAAAPHKQAVAICQGM